MKVDHNKPDSRSQKEVSDFDKPSQASIPEIKTGTSLRLKTHVKKRGRRNPHFSSPSLRKFT